MGEEQKVANCKVQALNARRQELEDKHAQLGAKLQAAEEVRGRNLSCQGAVRGSSKGGALGSLGVKDGNAAGMLRGKPCCAWPETVSLKLQQAWEERGPIWYASAARHADGLVSYVQR